MNDFYSAQDVTILCEIVENKFELMYNPYGYNPRKCNLASSISVCIQRDLSRTIIALPTNKTSTQLLKNNNRQFQFC